MTAQKMISVVPYPVWLYSMSNRDARLQWSLKGIFDTLEEKGIDTRKLPRLHISGCPHSCGTHQIGEIGFHGAVKLVDKKPTVAFILVDGGSGTYGLRKLW